MAEERPVDTSVRKRTYEAPGVVDLGHTREGRGLCSTGSADATDCTNGGAAQAYCDTGAAGIVI